MSLPPLFGWVGMLTGGAITDVGGIEVGHHTLSARPTGCTVILARGGAVGGVDVRGGAPGTRDTDLLDPVNLVQEVHGVVLSGGSLFGLDAVSGAVRWRARNRCNSERLSFPPETATATRSPSAIISNSRMALLTLPGPEL